MSRPDALITICDNFLLVEARTRRERLTVRVQRRLEKALARAFMAQSRMFVREFHQLAHLFQESITPADWLPYFSVVSGRTLALFSEPLDKAVQEGLRIGALQMIGDIGFDINFNLHHPAAVAYLDNYGARLVKGIDDTTRDYLQTTISNAVARGDSPKQVEAAIIERYEMFAVGKPQQHIDSRAHFIAVTEIGNAYEQGADIAARDIQAGGIELEKKWIGPRDGRTSEACLGNMDEGWISFDQAFSSGHHRPLRHPGCRHSLATRRKRD